MTEKFSNYELFPEYWIIISIFQSFQSIIISIYHHFSLKNQIGDKEKLGGKLSEDEQSKIEEVINEKIKWLEDNPVSW